MKKILSVLILLLFMTPVAFAAFSNYSEWQQAGPGMYFNNLNVQGNTIFGTYKYTKQLPGFQQAFGQYKTQNGQSIDYVTVNITVNCNSKIITMSDFKAYDTSNVLIYSNNVPQSKQADANVVNLCKTAGIGN